MIIYRRILPSDKSATPHFHQFGELTAERRFFVCSLKYISNLINEWMIINSD